MGRGSGCSGESGGLTRVILGYTFGKPHVGNRANMKRGERDAGRLVKIAGLHHSVCRVCCFQPDPEEETSHCCVLL